MSLPDIFLPEGRSFWADWLGVAGFAISLATLVVASWSVQRTRAIENMFLAVQRRARLRPLVSDLRARISKARDIGASTQVDLEEAATRLEKELQLILDQNAPQSFASEASRAIVNLRQLQSSLRSRSSAPSELSSRLSHGLAKVHESMVRLETELADDAERSSWRGQQP